MAYKKSSIYIDPHQIAKLKNLTIKAQTIVEGMITGLHKSPHHGINVEFKEHRQYFPGDDIKHIDWRVFAKTDKFFIKRFEEETNLFIYILLDISNSMDFKYNNENISKIEYAKYLASSIMYLALLQNDTPGVVLFSNNIVNFFEPRNSFSYINNIIKNFEKLQPSGETSFKKNLIKVAQKIKKRSLILLISDFMGDINDIIEGIKYLKGKKNDVVLFSINDEAEREFPYKDNIKFIDMETEQSIILNAHYIKDEYKRNFDNHYYMIKKFALKSRIDYFPFYTATNFGESLYSYLIKRSQIVDS